MYKIPIPHTHACTHAHTPQCNVMCYCITGVYAAVDVYGQCVEISIRSGIDHAYIINSMVANPFTTSTGKEALKR